MYDPLWEEHPKVKRIKAQAKADAEAEVKAELEAKMKAEAEAEARVKEEIEARMKAEAEVAQAYNALQDSVLALVQTRFPDLKDLAEQSLKRVDSPEVLRFLLIQVASAANETAARYILHPSAA